MSSTTSLTLPVSGTLPKDLLNFINILKVNNKDNSSLIIDLERLLEVLLINSLRLPKGIYYIFIYSFNLY